MNSKASDSSEVEIIKNELVSAVQHNYSSELNGKKTCGRREQNENIPANVGTVSTLTFSRTACPLYLIKFIPVIH